MAAIKIDVMTVILTPSVEPSVRLVDGPLSWSIVFQLAAICQMCVVIREKGETWVTRTSLRIAAHSWHAQSA